jgi:hypothetical protein
MFINGIFVRLHNIQFHEINLKDKYMKLMSNRVTEASAENCFTQSNPIVFKFLHNFKQTSMKKLFTLKFQHKLMIMFLLFLHQNPREI